MKLTEKQISRIYREIKLDDQRKIVEIDVTHQEEGWSVNETCFNIYCIDSAYNITWQVTEPKTKPYDDTDAFVYLGQKEGEIRAGRSIGFEYRINPETGEATRIAFHK
jgi:hypothetical protein